MTTLPRKCEDPEDRIQQKHNRRPWPIIAVVSLLLGQMIGYFVLSLWLSTEARGIDLEDILQLEQATALLLITLSAVVLVGAAFFGVVTILRQWQSGWQNAMLVQLLSLALGLALYFGPRPFFTHIILAYAVLTVFYLILPGVQAAFLPVEDSIHDTL